MTTDGEPPWRWEDQPLPAELIVGLTSDAAHVYVYLLNLVVRNEMDSYDGTSRLDQRKTDAALRLLEEVGVYRRRECPGGGYQHQITPVPGSFHAWPPYPVMPSMG